MTSRSLSPRKDSAVSGLQPLFVDSRANGLDGVGLVISSNVVSCKSLSVTVFRKRGHGIGQPMKFEDVYVYLI